MNSLFTVNDIQNILGATLIGTINGDINSIVLDSRGCSRGALFIPLIGEVQNGNLYIEAALENGAKYSLVTESYYNKNKGVIDSVLKKFPCGLFVVKDTLLALHKLAKYHIEKYPKLKKIVITGSSGKTSTKEILGSILKKTGNVLVTKGNYNSETGLPLTVFGINKTHEYAVLELGMNKPGEIKALVDIVNPNIGIITNIGRAHIGFFEDIQGIAKEKKTVFSNFTDDSIGIIPDWDMFSNFLQRDIKGKIISVSKIPDYIGNITNLWFNGWEFYYENTMVHFPYIGEYNFLNALLAISCGRILGVSPRDIKNGLEDVKPIFGRGELLEGRNIIIRDCYNANPDSMKNAIDMFKETKYKGEKIPVLGSMYELGDGSLEAHIELCKYAIEHFSTVVFCGEEFCSIKKMIKVGLGSHFYKNIKDLKAGIIHDIPNGSLVLLKASRGMKLEEITESIL